jgi:hypothetical protein
VVMDLIDSLLQFTRLSQPQLVAATDGTLHASAGLALVHDLVETKWQRLLPTLEDGETVRRTRIELHLSQSQLAREAEISQPMLGMIETGKRRITEPMVMKVWGALWRLHQAQITPPAVELLIRLNTELDTMIVSERIAL